jgi:hypothetical protein
MKDMLSVSSIKSDCRPTPRAPVDSFRFPLTESPALGLAWAGSGLEFLKPEPEPSSRAWPGLAWACVGRTQFCA